jgi:hypothetical protein
MKYSRTEMNADVFGSILPEGAMIYQKPELPKYEFKANKVKYTVSDLRLLHPSGVGAFESILKVVANTPDCKEISFDVSYLDEDTINIVTDILMGITYTAKKGGKNGFEQSGIFLITGVEREENIMTCHFIREHAKAIYMYAHENQKKQINIQDLVILLAEDSRRRLLEVLEVEE